MSLTRRGDKIRTCDPLIPNQVLYQTEPHPANDVNIITTSFCRQHFFREKLNYTFLEIRDGLIPMIFIGYCYEFILPIKYVTNILQFLGKHSMNIFLTHTFIRYYYFKDFTYSFKYSILIVLVLLGISIIVSMVIELLKKAIKYNEFIEFLKQKVDRKIDKNNEIREK